MTPLDAQAFLTTLNIIVFFLLGLVLLRNRDCWRRILCERGRGWLSATWPATILLPGSLLVGLAIVWMNERNLGLGTGRKLGIFRAAFFAAWLLRDVLYLQWMSLRRTRRALVLAVLYLIVYYTCATVLFGALGFFAQAEQAPYIAILVPLPVFALDAKVWVAHPAWWVFALVMQIFAAGLFATFQSQKLRELAPAAGVPTLATGR